MEDKEKTLVCQKSGKTGKYGYVDAQGKEVIPFIYARARDFEDGYAMVRDEESQYCKFIDESGKIVYTLECKKAEIITQGKVIFLKNRKWGMVDITNGKMILPCEYTSINSHEGNEIEIYGKRENRILKIEKGKKWGLVDLDGKIVLPLEYGCISVYIGEKIVAEVEKDEKWGVIDIINKKIILPLEYDAIHVYDYIQSSNRKKNVYCLLVVKNEKCGLIDLNGDIILPLEYDGILNVQKMVKNFSLR